MCQVLILLFIIITFIKNPENAPNLLALDHHLPLRRELALLIEASKTAILYVVFHCQNDIKTQKNM